ncbi:MAG: sensor histidine kinase [Sphingobacteriaceae bacterium]|nr:MAG: sensor histidine kinase [Sphingobacteriaceae bacterium]
MKNSHLKLNKLIQKLIGPAETTNLESRIFHTVAILCAIALFINATINGIAGRLFVMVFMLIIVFLLLIEYYLCRVKQKLGIALMLFGLIGNLSFALIYLNDSAIDGPGTYAFILLVFLLIAIAPKNQYAFWMILNLVVVTGLLLVTYHYPVLIHNPYPDKAARYITIGYNYAFFTILIGLVTIYLKNTYAKQKGLIEDKARLLKEVNEMKNKLFSIIAHDLRSPLASIQSYLEVISEFEIGTEEKKKMEQELLLKTKDTEQMLYNMLHWTAGQMDGIKVNLAEVNLKNTVLPVLQIIQASALEKGITIINLLPGTVTLNADKDMLQLIVRNLVNNAIKFTPPGGEITISQAFEGSFCKVMICDNGVGISDERQTAIFSLQTKSTYGTGQEKGTGLGLILCKEFVELQHGQIGFESQPGKGTTFYFTLMQLDEQNQNMCRDQKSVQPYKCMDDVMAPETAGKYINDYTPGNIPVSRSERAATART